MDVGYIFVWIVKNRKWVEIMGKMIGLIGSVVIGKLIVSNMI